MSFNRLLFLILVAGLTFLAILFLARPDLLEDIWMWLIGLSGTIIKAGQTAVQSLKRNFGDDAPSEIEGQVKAKKPKASDRDGNQQKETTNESTTVVAESIPTNTNQNSTTMNDEAQWGLYENFSKEEFDCKHSGKNEMKHSFMLKLQQLRTAYGKPMKITSGFRDYSHPVEAKKERKNGAHPTGKAADIAVDRQNAYEVLKLAMELGFTGIGVKQHGSGRFLHVDTIEGSPEQPRPTIWSYK